MESLMLAAAVGYGLGSVPFGLVLTAAAGLGDVRAIGSGNIGATNVLRTGRRDLAAWVLGLDAGKALVAVLVGRWLGGSGLGGSGGAVVAGVAAVLGHLFPVWLGFRGGKGVACGFGVLLGLVWPGFVVAAVVWGVVARVWRISSAAALSAFAVAPVAAWWFGGARVGAAMAVVSGLIACRHAGNIRRLLDGTEPRMGETAAAAAVEAAG